MCSATDGTYVCGMDWSYQIGIDRDRVYIFGRFLDGDPLQGHFVFQRFMPPLPLINLLPPPALHPLQ